MTGDTTTGGNVAEIVGLYRELDDLLDRIAAADSTPATSGEVVAVAEAHERSARRMSFFGLQRLLECSDRNVVAEEGYRSLGDFMVDRLRITDPGRRRKQMAALLSLHALSGELLDPLCPTLAEAYAEGAIGVDHAVTVITVLDKLPTTLDAEQRAAAEELMADYARVHSPQELTTLGARLLAHLDPDGALTDEKDRARRRSLHLSKQDAQLMSTLEGQLDPVTRALLDVVLDAWAAPGMNNPADEASPRGSKDDADPEALKQAAERDLRTPGQRNHDALHALLKAVADGGLLGKSHRGLPPHLIITISETELRERAGVGTTAGGALLPIADVIELAAEAQEHLAVFADHTAQPLYLGRANRFASQAQRMMLLARDGAVCTCPGCSQPFTRTEAHHAEQDWVDGGLTDIQDLAAACPTHNRMVGDKPGQWSTHIVTDGPDAGRPAWTRNTKRGKGKGRPRVRVDRTREVAEAFARHLRRGDRPRPPDNRCGASQPKTPTGPPGHPEERRRVGRLIASGWAVNVVELG
ncbi:DUF222 domain-containing protein [Gordonia sp. NPDC003424]